MTPRPLRGAFLLLVAAGWILLSASSLSAAIVTAGSLLVNLDANVDASAGTANWLNSGTLGGSFAAQGTTPPKVFLGPTNQPGVQFDGTNWALGPNSAAGIEGNGDVS